MLLCSDGLSTCIQVLTDVRATLLLAVILSCVLPAAIANNAAGPRNGKVFTEEDWNTDSTVNHEPYRYSKVSHSRKRCCMAWVACTASYCSLLCPDGVT